MLVALAAGAVVALFAGGLPPSAAWVGAVASCTHAAWLVRRESRRPPLVVELPAARVDGVEVEAMAVAWRGPVAFMRWRQPCGATRRLAWWPDVLPPAERRRLRLALGQEKPSPVLASVAP